MLTATHTANFLLASAKANGVDSQLFKAQWTSIASSTAVYPSSYEELSLMSRGDLLRSMKNFNPSVLLTDPLLVKQATTEGVDITATNPDLSNIAEDEEALDDDDQILAEIIGYIGHNRTGHGSDEHSDDYLASIPLRDMEDADIIELPTLPNGMMVAPINDGDIHIVDGRDVPHSFSITYDIPCHVQQWVKVIRPVTVRKIARIEFDTQVERGHFAETVRTLYRNYTSANSTPPDEEDYNKIITGAICDVLANFSSDGEGVVNRLGLLIGSFNYSVLESQGYDIIDNNPMGIGNLIIANGVGMNIAHVERLSDTDSVSPIHNFNEDDFNMEFSPEVVENINTVLGSNHVMPGINQMLPRLVVQSTPPVTFATLYMEAMRVMQEEANETNAAEELLTETNDTNTTTDTADVDDRPF